MTTHYARRARAGRHVKANRTFRGTALAVLVTACHWIGHAGSVPPGCRLTAPKAAGR